MKHGISIATLGKYADPRPVVELARAAEVAGWEGLFVWDHLAFAWGVPSGDPWVILSAVAQATSRLRIGTAVTPLARRRPQVLANTVATLDLLSDGRVVLGAGLGGVAEEFAAFGEPAAPGIRARQLDESLDLINRLMAGESISHQGESFTIENVTLAPLPMQRPRVPIWIGGESPPALRRAARWDGWVAVGDNESAEMIKTPEQIAQAVGTIRGHRATPLPFEVALTGVSAAGERDLFAGFAAAGVTWWLESLHGFRGDFDFLMRRVLAGPAG